MRIVAGGRTVDRFATSLIILAALIAAATLIDHAFAQGSPFGTPRTSPFGGPRPGTSPVPIGGVVGWVIAKAAEFQLQFSRLIRAAKDDGTAAWSLMGVSFLYGVFHAAGPGHGKMVISSYLVANEETWVRGVVLSFLSAVMQALVAIAIVGIAAALLNATAATMVKAANWAGTLGYLFIVVIGLRLFWVKGRAFITAFRALGRPTAEVGAALTANAAHGHTHDYHDHAHAHEHAHDSSCDHDHAHHDRDGHAHHDHEDDASAWGHAHAPEPEELAGPGGWRRGLSAIVAVGLRPCSGALLVLVFALTQGLFWIGVGSTFVMGLGTFITVALIASLAVGARSWASRMASARSSYGTLAMRGIEVGAALVIMAFGALLLTGYMVQERMPVL
jgi:nickel/cobalt transporter (NicO) family protein